MKEHLVKYISYINNILAKVKLMELIVLKVGSRWVALVGVATKCPANGLLGSGAGRAHALIRCLGRMHEFKPACAIQSSGLPSYPANESIVCCAIEPNQPPQHFTPHIDYPPDIPPSDDCLFTFC